MHYPKFMFLILSVSIAYMTMLLVVSVSRHTSPLGGCRSTPLGHQQKEQYKTALSVVSGSDVQAVIRLMC